MVMTAATMATKAITGTARRATRISESQLPDSSARPASLLIAARTRVNRNGEVAAASIVAASAEAASITTRPARSSSSFRWLFTLNISALRATLVCRAHEQKTIKTARKLQDLFVRKVTI